MNKKLTLTSFCAAAAVFAAGSYVVLTHDSAKASTSAPVKKEPASAKTGSDHALPGGASSLNETYQDWRLSCGQAGTGSRCVVSQQEFDGKTRQRILSIEFSSTSGQLKGVAVLPFGVALEKGATIVADGKPVGAPLGFSTCMPAGCIAPLSLDHAQLSTIQNAQKLEVKFSSITGQQVALPFSNKGLDKAIARSTALGL